MISNIIMPKAGMAMETGKIVKWLVKKGDKVKTGDAVLEIETDKVNMEVEAFSAGTVLMLTAKEGDVVPVTKVIGYIGDPGDKLPKPDNKKTTASSEKKSDYDVIVVGGGPAGYVCAIKAAQLGGKAAVIEKDILGGTCLNRGCIPTKTYLKTAEILTHIRTSGYRGINLAQDSIAFDMKAAKADKNSVVKKLTGGVSALLKANGIEVLYGAGVINKDKSVTVADKNYFGKSIVFAGGSLPAKLPISGIDCKYVVTSDELLDIDEVPKRLAVIGNGVIGVELGQAFRAFGSDVTIIEMMERITPNMDEDISELLKKEMIRQGIKVKTSARVDKVEERDGYAVLNVGNEQIEADLILLCAGRTPDLSGIENIGIETDKGCVIVNDHMKTNIEGIYAAGDATGMCMLAHAAFKMGEAAAENALGGDVGFDALKIPACIYTNPEAAAIGLTEAQAKKRYDISTGMFPFSANGRALAGGESAGFVKVVADKKYGEILGVHIIGPGAAEMINEAALMMAMEVTCEEMKNIAHAHPTYSEALMEAAAHAIGACIHLPPKNKLHDRALDDPKI